MPILNYTTTIDPLKTLGEIQALLARHGAKSCQVEYENRQPAKVWFVITTTFGDREFHLPAPHENVWRALVKQNREGKIARRFITREQAARVAWRILKDWLEAQLALIEAELVPVDQIMLPYMVVTPKGDTVYEVMHEHLLALPMPSQEQSG